MKKDQQRLGNLGSGQFEDNGTLTTGSAGSLARIERGARTDFSRCHPMI